MFFFIADTHFGHNAIIDLCHRPFKCVEEMDSFMIERWNEKVSHNDTVYIIGDLFYKHKDPEKILKQLKGKKRLIVGNHDGGWLNRMDASRYFVSVDRLIEVSAPAEATQAAPEVEEKIDFSNVQIEPLFQDQVDFDTFSKSDFRAVKVKECEAVKKSKKLLKFVLDDGTGVDRVILSGIHEYYEPEELVGKTCIAITNLPPRAMMGIDSCGMLISAVHHENGEEKLHLLMVDPHIPAGAKLY